MTAIAIHSPQADALKRIFVVGLPNTGKSWTFNHLTNSYSIVANYPFTTVELIHAACTIGGVRYEVVDTPGLHSLYIQAEEEMVTRNALFERPPSLIIQCADAARIKQSLKLTAELAELGLPMVMVLTAVNDARKAGLVIHAEELSALVGVPVIAVRDLEDHGAKKLRSAPDIARIPSISLEYGTELNGALERLLRNSPTSVPFARASGLLLLQNDLTMHALIRNIAGNADACAYTAAADSIRDSLPFTADRAIAAQRNAWVESVYSRVVKQCGAERVRKSDIAARLCRHPFTGPPIMAIIITLTYLAVAKGGGALEEAISDYLVDPTVAFLAARISPPWLNGFLVGEYGLLTIGVFNAFCTVLPILGVFFLVFALLEDSGYIPNLCVLTSRLAGRMGITGKAIMPLVLGLSCKTMATLLTRGLQSRKEKCIAIFLIAFAMPCSAQLGLDMAILGRAGVSAFLIAYGFLIIFELAAGWILNRILPNDIPSELLQELPPLRVPHLRSVWTKTYYRLAVFIREALPIFIIAAAILYVVSITGILGKLQRLLAPVVTGWLGLPSSMVEALLLMMARHEAGSGMVLKMANAGMLDWSQTIVAVTLITMFVPCFANMAAIFREMGAKAGVMIILSINIISFLLAGFLRMLLQVIEPLI